MERLEFQLLEAIRPRHALEDEGWTYVDPPARFYNGFWEVLLSEMGEGNYLILCESSGTDREGKAWRRGQLLVSPDGMQRLKERVSRREKEAAQAS